MGVSQTAREGDEFLNDDKANFIKGIAFYNLGKYEDAKSMFSSCLKNDLSDHYEDAQYFQFLTKLQIEQKLTDELRLELQDLVKTSSYSDKLKKLL